MKKPDAADLPIDAMALIPQLSQEISMLVLQRFTELGTPEKDRGSLLAATLYFTVTLQAYAALRGLLKRDPTFEELLARCRDEKTWSSSASYVHGIFESAKQQGGR